MEMIYHFAESYAFEINLWRVALLMQVVFVSVDADQRDCILQVVKVTGIKNMGRTVSIIVRGSNALVRESYCELFHA